MGHISDLHDYSSEECDTKGQECLSEHRKKAIKSEVEQLIDDEFDRLEENAGYFITQTAADRAERFLEKVLEGDKEAAAELIGIRGEGRYRQFGYKDGEPWASLIDGRLFETNSIVLRRQIVEAHPELIRNERIADLESIVEGLTQQLRKVQKELEECRDRS